MLKDLFVAHLFNDFSGSPRVLRDAIDANSDCTGDCYLFTSQHSGFLDGSCAIHIPVFYRRSHYKIIQLFYYFISQIHFFILLSYFLLRSKCRKRQRTLLINTMLPFGAGLAGKLFASNVIYYIHESHISPYLLKKFLRLIVEYCADNVLFVSKYLLETETFNSPTQQVIYNGLRGDFSANPVINPIEKFDSKLILFAGSLKVYKGIEQLINMAIRLSEYKFVAALNCSDDELNLFLENKSIPSNMKIVIRPENLQDLYKSSFLVVNLSLPELWVETFGLSLLEGMSFGCPVIAPEIGGPTEFVDVSNGFLSDSRDIDKIEQFIRSLSADYDLWVKYSQSAQRVAKQFSAGEYKIQFHSYMIKNNFI